MTLWNGVSSLKINCQMATRCKNRGDPELCHTDVFRGVMWCFEMDPNYYGGIVKGGEKNGKTVFHSVAGAAGCHNRDKR